MKGSHTVSLLSLVAGLVSGAPTQQLSKRHGTDVSNLKYYQYPAALPNGHSLFSPVLYHQVQESQPTTVIHPHTGHFGGDTRTYEVFDFPPEEFSGRTCRFHFLLGPADGGKGYGDVWSVEGDASEETTWENRPKSVKLVATFDVDPDEIHYYRSGDEGGNFLPPTEDFPCPTGKKTWEIRAGSGDKEDGRVGPYGNSATWSLNKGLLIERLQ